MRTELSGRLGLAAGEGLGASGRLIREVLKPALRLRGELEDGHRLAPTEHDRVITSDVFSVDPIRFPGGNIGGLAAAGVCNDLLASGALVTDVALGIFASAELEISVLLECLESFASVLADHQAWVVCGDTKVHPSPAPELLLFATGVGRAWSDARFDLGDTADGDAIIISGSLGDHSIAVLSQREGLGYESVVTSDARSLVNSIAPLARSGLIHSMRDLTRGGLVAALWDGFAATGLQWRVDERSIPVKMPVRAAAEMLGIDVLALTNEGCMLITCPAAKCSGVLDVLRASEATAGATAIGSVAQVDNSLGPVLIDDGGIARLLPLPHAMGIPRLC